MVGPRRPGLVAGDEVLPETEVALVVSAGPAPRVLPDLTGLSVADATAQLEAMRLVVAVAEPAVQRHRPGRRRGRR